MAQQPLPELSVEQRETGLVRARSTRHRRGELLDRVRSGELDLAGFLALLDDSTTTPEERSIIAGTRVRHALLAVPGIGARKADRILAELTFAKDRRWASVGRRQRKTILAAVGLLRSGPCDPKTR